MAEKRKRDDVWEYNRQWMHANRQRKRLLQEDIDRSSLVSENDASSPEISLAEDNSYSLENNPVEHDQNFAGSEASSSEESVYLHDDSDHDDSDEENLHEQNDYSESSEPEDELNLRSDLVQWINKNSVTGVAATELLKIINSHFETDLPNDSRTLLKTVRTVDVEQKSGMDYVNLGVKDQLRANLSKYSEETMACIQEVSISLNIDGLPLFKSTCKSLWPVLCSINIKPVVVFPIVLTFGKSKPRNLDFLTDLVNELTDVLENGLAFKERVLLVSLSCIVCDAPAKSFVKGIKQYSGYYGCDMCDQKGVWLESRITYQDIDNLQIRTDESFRNRRQVEHHNNVTPFCLLPIDMINTFSIDYMHQVCLGVTKKLLNLWIKGDHNVKLSSNQVNEISSRLIQLKKDIPNIFSRKPRGLDEVERWKATEFRQFLLYTGKIVLKGILRHEFYQHFLALNVAIGIMVNPRLLQQHRQYAHELLVFFVKEGYNLYGQKFLIYNVHMMLHLSQSVSNFNSLDSSSAFAFENYMQILKRNVRSGNKPIVQIVKRLLEMQDNPVFMKKNLFRCKRPNNIYFIKDSNKVCEVVAKADELDESGNKKNVCRVFQSTNSVFHQPCDSSLIGVLEGNKRRTTMKVLPNRSLTRQAMMIVKDETHALFMAVLHDF